MISYNHESFEGFPRTNNKSRWQYDGHDGPYTVTSLLPFTRVLSQLQVNRERQGIAWGFPGSVLKKKVSLRVIKKYSYHLNHHWFGKSRLVNHLLKHPLFASARPLGQFLLPAIPKLIDLNGSITRTLLKQPSCGNIALQTMRQRHLAISRKPKNIATGRMAKISRDSWE